jgi:hypothetical protein
MLAPSTINKNPGNAVTRAIERFQQCANYRGRNGTCKPGAATSSSRGTAFGGGWRQWWCEQSAIDHADWRCFIDAAGYALRQLRVLHVPGAFS